MEKQLTLAERMKAYERETRPLLTQGKWYIIRLDGKNFSTYTRGLKKPFDPQFAADMDETTRELCKEITGAVLAYTQSDEISIIFHSMGGANAEPHLGGNLSKILSLSAAKAATVFNRLRPQSEGIFDARVVELPNPEEVLNYLIWRQRDAERNSVMMAARTFFSHQQLNQVNVSQAKEMLKSINEPWEELEAGFRQGRFSRKETHVEKVTYVDKRTNEEIVTDALRSSWVTTAERVENSMLEELKRTLA